MKEGQQHYIVSRVDHTQWNCLFFISYKRNCNFPNSYLGNSGEKRLHGRPEMRWRTLNSVLRVGQYVVLVSTRIARFQVLLMVLITVHVF